MRPPPDDPEECANVDELDRWWAKAAGPYVANYRDETMPRPRNQAGCLLVVFAGVCAGGLFAAASSGWFAVLAVIVGIILLIGPVLKEMTKDTSDYEEYTALYEAYRRRHNELLRSSEEEDRWIEARVEDLDQLSNRDDVERWWRHAQRRCGVNEKSGPPTRVAVFINIAFLLFIGSLGLPVFFGIQKDPQATRAAWWIALLIAVAPLGYTIWAVRSLLRTASDYRAALDSYERKRVELGEEPKW